MEDTNIEDNHEKKSIIVIRLPREQKKRFVSISNRQQKTLAKWILDACEKEVEEFNRDKK